MGGAMLMARSTGVRVRGRRPAGDPPAPEPLAAPLADGGGFPVPAGPVATAAPPPKLSAARPAGPTVVVVTVSLPDPDAAAEVDDRTHEALAWLALCISRLKRIGQLTRLDTPPAGGKITARKEVIAGAVDLLTARPAWEPKPEQADLNGRTLAWYEPANGDDGAPVTEPFPAPVNLTGRPPARPAWIAAYERELGDGP
jgi:hypothetical protein